MTSRGRSLAAAFATWLASLSVVLGGAWLAGCGARPKGAASSLQPDSAYADYWAARDAAFRACLDDDGAACLRAAFGPYLLSDVDRWVVSRKGCQLGEALACESGCAFELDGLGEPMMEALRKMPALQAHDDATATAFRETCRRSWRYKPAEWNDRVAQACAGDGEAPQCLATRALREASLDDGEGAVPLAAAAPQAISHERAVALCASGHGPSCRQLAVSEQPLDAAPACLAGERHTCGLLAAALVGEPNRRAASIPPPDPFKEDLHQEQREDAAAQLERATRQVLTLLLQQCGAVPWACPSSISPVESPWYRRFLVVDGVTATCPQAIAQARQVAKLPPLAPGRERQWALAGCERHLSAAQRSCLAIAKAPSDLFNCASALRAEDVLAAEAHRLALESQTFFDRAQRLPAAWPKTELLPACCGEACAPPAPKKPSATPIYDENNELVGVENGDAEGQAYRDIEEQEEASGVYRYEDDDDNTFESELRSSSPKDSANRDERYFWAHLMLEREGDVVIASARGRRTCSEPELIVEERWQLVDGKPRSAAQTRRTAPASK